MMKNISLIGILAIMLFFTVSCKTTSKGQKASPQKEKTEQKNEDYKSEINTRYKAMMAAMSEADAVKMLDYMYPKLFDIAPREMVETTMAGSFEEMTLVTKSLDIVKYSKKVESNGEQFVLLDYVSKMDIIINTIENEEDITMYLESFKVVYGEGNVKQVNDKTLAVDVKDKSTFAIKYEKDGLWYFLENKKGNPMYEQLIPEEVITELGL